MMRTLVRLIVIALLANATWHVFSVYLAHYRFKDSVENTAQFAASMSDGDLRRRVLDLASEFDVPLSPDNLKVERAGESIVIDASYVKALQLLPGYEYPWSLTCHLEVWAMKLMKGPKSS